MLKLELEERRQNIIDRPDTQNKEEKVKSKPYVMISNPENKEIPPNIIIKKTASD
jgi:hypothetical protein